MTQKEKLMRAIMFAQNVKSITKTLEHEMESYDCSWPKECIDSLNRAADEYLKLK